MDWNNEYTEPMWRDDADARERAAVRDEEMQMQDWHAGPLALARCDGSGILEEFYIDVDQTQVIRCPGCCACEEGQLEQRSEEHTSELQSLRHLVCRLLL